MRTATTVGFHHCGCGSSTCNTIYLMLYDERGRSFARIPFSTEEWLKFFTEGPSEIARQDDKRRAYCAKEMSK